MINALKNIILSLQCTICGRSFVTNTHLNHHVKMVHEKQRNVPCDICHKMFADGGKVRRHKKNVHGVIIPAGLRGKRIHEQPSFEFMKSKIEDSD